MAKVKKAQLGEHLYMRQSQDDRIHRIEKKDPKRAERVANRVQKRALRSVKPSPVKPTGKIFIPLSERAKAAREKKAAEAGKAPKAQKGDSLTFSTTGRYAPKQRVAVDTTGYASGKKEFMAKSELGKKPRKVGRKLVDRTISAIKAGKIKKAQWGSSEGGRCGISRAAAKDARKSERDYAKQSRQAEREQKRESKAAAKQAKRTPSMRKGGNIIKKK
jgi:hypothetical protein